MVTMLMPLPVKASKLPRHQLLQLRCNGKSLPLHAEPGSALLTLSYLGAERAIPN